MLGDSACASVFSIVTSLGLLICLPADVGLFLNVGKCKLLDNQHGNSLMYGSMFRDKQYPP